MNSGDPARGPARPERLSKPPPTPVPSQENRNISGRGYELLCVCVERFGIQEAFTRRSLGGRTPPGTHTHCCLFLHLMDQEALDFPPHPPRSLVFGGKLLAREHTEQPEQGPRGRTRRPSHQPALTLSHADGRSGPSQASRCSPGRAPELDPPS